MPPPAEGFAARLVLGPALRTQPDRRLVALVRNGYETAFEEIVRRYGRPLTRYAAAIVGGRAEDVTQDAFSKALLALRRNGAEIELRPWLFRIVRNTALNDLRDSPPTAAELAEAIATGGNPAEELERREDLTDLMERLRSLPDAQRAAIVMREMEGLSHDEIAAALGLSGGAARQAIYRARQTLRDGLGLLLPMPLLKSLLTGTAAVPMEAAAGAAGVGGSAVSAGVALKAATATVLVAGAVGAGVAVHDSQRGQLRAEARPEQQALAEDSAATRPAAASLTASDDSGAQGDDHGHGSRPGRDGENGPGGGQRHHGSNSGSGGSGSGDRETGGDRRDHGKDGTSDDGGRRGPSEDDHSGGDRSGSGGSGRSPAGPSSSGDGQRSGSGGGEDHSGPGSGGSTSGSGDASPPTEGFESSGSSGSDSSGGGSGSSGGGGDESNLEGSGDSRGSEGLSLQTEPQT